MPRQTHTAFAKELEKHDALMAQRFLELVARMTSQAQIRALDQAISDRDFVRVFTVLQLDNAFWAPLDRQIQESFISGATWQLSQLPKKPGPAGLDLRIGFNHRNPRAEMWVQQRSELLITEITQDTRKGVRDVIAEGIEQGWGVQRTRASLIGRLEGNQRKGGIIGLHSRGVAAVIKARRELSDPERMGEYLRRVGGNAPGRATVKAAIRADRPLNPREVDRVVRMYSDRLLQVRGQAVARTEAHGAFTSGMDEATRQLVESGKVPPEAVTLEWQSTVASPRTRDTHRSMNGQVVRFGEAFTSPKGAKMLYPGDTSQGAPGEETVNCRCSARPRIDFKAVARLRGTL